LRILGDGAQRGGLRHGDMRRKPTLRPPKSSKRILRAQLDELLILASNLNVKLQMSQLRRRFAGSTFSDFS
jgi:hypothetical protein